MDKKNCLLCKKKFYRKYRNKKSWEDAKYCSHFCYWKSLTGIERGGKIIINCNFCKKEFVIFKYLLKHNKKYCSHSCAAKYRHSIKAFIKTRHINLKCLNCDKKFDVFPSLKNKKYCSAVCKNKFQKGEKHPAWQGGKSSEYERFRQTEEYKIWRKKVFERDNYVCQKCGFRNGHGYHLDLHPHHVKYAGQYHNLRLNLDNGITLCKRCHGKEHSVNFKNRKYKYM